MSLETDFLHSRVNKLEARIKILEAQIAELLAREKSKKEIRNEYGETISPYDAGVRRKVIR